jgi:hypothetical protein
MKVVVPCFRKASIPSWHYNELLLNKLSHAGSYFGKIKTFMAKNIAMQ